MRDHPSAGRDPATTPAKKKAAAAKPRGRDPLDEMKVIVTGIDVATGKKVSVLVSAQGRDPATGKNTD